MGLVHEELEHPRSNPALADYTYCHLGYVKPAREVARRWEYYRSLGATVHDYDRDAPDHALDDWPRICHVFTGEHPPAVREVLEDYPSAPDGIYPKLNHAPRVGLVLLTWDDAENLRPCLDSLAHTTEPFELCVIDNGSADEGLDLIRAFAERTGTPTEIFAPDDDVEAFVGLSLAEALNRGFGHFMEREGLDYVGWFHPDHKFDWPEWLAELRTAMDEHPEYAKLGASEAGNQFAEPRAGNSQAYIVRKSALAEVGLFDERFVECGGREDWEHNVRLLRVGKVMIWPTAVVRHEGMSTRRRHDNEDAGRQNADTYYELVGQWEPLV